METAREEDGYALPGGNEVLIMFDEKLTAHLAELSKLEFNNAELERMTEDMAAIVGLMDKVRSFEADEKPYTAEPVSYGALRADNYNKSYPTEDILKNAANVKNDSFVVPKVV